MVYTFDTKVLFTLGKLVQHFQTEIDEIVSLIPALMQVQQGKDLFDMVDADKLMSIVMNVMTKSVEAEDILIEFLALSSRQTQEQIRAMDGYTFIEELRGAFTSIDWQRLLKKSIGLTLTPQPNQSGEEKNQKTVALTGLNETSDGLS